MGDGLVTAETPGGPRLSVVLAVFNERENLGPLIAEITDALRPMPHEIVAVDDASTDGSLVELERLTSAYHTLRVTSLRRRSGQSAALAAGWDAARGPLIATLDADGQNDPADLERLLRPVDAGDADAAVGIRNRRQDTRWKRFQSRTANRVRDWITGDSVADTGCGLRVIPADLVRRLPRFKGMHRFLPTLMRREGARVVEIPVRHRPRLHGRTKYGMWGRVFVGIWDALGVRWLLERRLPASTRKDAADDA